MTIFSSKVGEGGLGRRSCTQLACHIAKCDYHCLPFCEESPGEALEAIKTVVMQCGVTEHTTCLVATESSFGSGQVNNRITISYSICVLMHAVL